MAFLRSNLGSDHAPLVRGKGIWLRQPTMSDYVGWSELRSKSRAHLTPWEPQWSLDELGHGAFRQRLRHYAREQRDDLGYAFFVFRTGDDALLGGMTLSNVRRGVSQSATLGYWVGLPFVRRGHMTAAVAAILGHGFEELRLHRIEAACLPSNAGSIGVLEGNGFQHEGLARRYLKINGVWQDHLLFARLREDEPVRLGRRG